MPLQGYKSRMSPFVHKRRNTLVPSFSDKIVVTDIEEFKGMERETKCLKWRRFNRGTEKGVKCSAYLQDLRKYSNLVPFAQNYKITRKTEIILSSSPAYRYNGMQTVGAVYPPPLNAP